MSKSISIPTGMYSDDTNIILKAVLGKMDCSYDIACYFRQYGLPVLKLERAPDGEICFAVEIEDVGWGRSFRFWNKHLHESFYAATPLASEVKKAKELIGWQIKCFAKGYLNRGIRMTTEEADREQAKKNWNRQSRVDLTEFLGVAQHVTIADLYFIYEKLIGRLEKSTNKYDSAVTKRLLGEKRDVISTEAEIARRAEVERINAEYKEKIRNATPTYNYGRTTSAAYLELERIINEFKARCKDNVAALEKERDEKLAEVNAVMSFMAM